MYDDDEYSLPGEIGPAPALPGQQGHEAAPDPVWDTWAEEDPLDPPSTPSDPFADVERLLERITKPAAPPRARPVPNLTPHDGGRPRWRLFLGAAAAALLAVVVWSGWAPTSDEQPPVPAPGPVASSDRLEDMLARVRQSEHKAFGSPN